jgi:hypothetical protein
MTASWIGCPLWAIIQSERLISSWHVQRPISWLIHLLRYPLTRIHHPSKHSRRAFIMTKNHLHLQVQLKLSKDNENVLVWRSILVEWSSRCKRIFATSVCPCILNGSETSLSSLSLSFIWIQFMRWTRDKVIWPRIWFMENRSRGQIYLSIIQSSRLIGWRWVRSNGRDVNWGRQFDFSHG